ncbi:ABC transporter ATP-binding protein [Paenalcaligenes hominis]|uniref:ABC transporter ATP-binding protein n=1 Tax=Paenalcaligenes hominis TaxID=643674 RepID=UPI0035239D4F
MSQALLHTSNLGINFGAFAAVSGITLSLMPGQRQALIGPNGAGKTSLINLLTGVYKPSTGDIFLAGENINALSFDARVRKGLVRTFQLNTLCLGMTPLDTLLMTLMERERKGMVWWKPMYQFDALRMEAMQLLTQVGLQGVEHHLVGELAYGKQRLLEIALALALKPKVLLLDEPAAGIPEGESDEVFHVIEQLPATMSVVFIEHDMDLVFHFAQRIAVLVAGKIIVDGTANEIIDHPQVREAYLGADFCAKGKSL